MDICNYEIHIKGHLDERWFIQFADVIVTHTTGGETVVAGQGMDQPMLYAVLNRIRDLGLELISVQRTAPQNSPTFQEGQS